MNYNKDFYYFICSMYSHWKMQGQTNNTNIGIAKTKSAEIKSSEV